MQSTEIIEIYVKLITFIQLSIIRSNMRTEKYTKNISSGNIAYMSVA